MAPLRTPLVRRRRAAARLALYGSVSLLAVLMLGLLALLRPALSAGAMTDWAGEDFAAYREVQLLRDYIAIDTATGTGDQAAGARWFAERLRELGLDPVLEPVGDELNVWAILEGEIPEAVVLHHHVDVDPVPNEEYWTYSPFGGAIDGPWLYGRGAFDMKSVAIAQLEALRALIESGEKPYRSVIVLATTGEEVGSDLGTRWLLARRPELVERFGVVLTEGGAVELDAPGQVRYWGTEVAQAQMVRVIVCGGDREAIERLREDVVAHLAATSEPRVEPELEPFFAEYGPTRLDADVTKLMEEPHRAVGGPGWDEGLSSYVRSFFHDGAFTREVREEPTGGYSFRVVLLLLPGTDVARVLAERLPPWLLHGFPYRVIVEGGAARGTPADHWAFETIDEVFARRRPEVVHGPLYLPATLTDARFFRAAGIPTLGFSPFDVPTPHTLQLRAGASVNERIALPGYLTGVELYRHVLAALAADERRHSR